MKQHFATKMHELEAMLVERGFARPEAFIAFNYIGYEFWLSVKAGEPGGESETFSFRVNDVQYPSVSDAIADCRKAIAEAPSPVDRRKQRFVQEFGRLLDEARDLDIELGREAGDIGEPDFIATMEEMMRRLSENILTDQRQAAE